MAKREKSESNASKPDEGNAAPLPSSTELLTLKLTPGQRTTVLEHVSLPADLAKKFKETTTDQFTPDEVHELLNCLEGDDYRASGNERQKIQRLIAQGANLLSTAIVSDAAGPRKFPKQTECVFQIKITLLGIKPIIWRRVQTKDCTLHELHRLIQTAMGWSNEHLYSFEIRGNQYSDSDTDFDDGEMCKARKTRLSKVLVETERRPRFTYEYDFGDNWMHSLIVEERLVPQVDVKYPRCIGGARACPPEDCGGSWAYLNLLESLQNKGHREHEETLEYLGESFDAEAFSLEAANKKLHSHE